jgi:tetratricopeptide (TPR) repeat protein
MLLKQIVRNFIILTILAAAGAAHAADKEAARRAYAEGSQYYDIGEYEAALQRFKTAYLAYADPAFLFNIGQCERQLGHKAEASKAFHAYLRNAAGAPDRALVEQMLAQLESSPAPAPPHANPAPPETGRGEGAHADAARGEVARAADRPDAARADLVASPPSRRPLVKRPWFWITVGSAAVVAAGAIALGVTLAPAGPSPSLGVVR